MEAAHGAPPPEYGRAFPDDLLKAVTKANLDALRQSGLCGHPGAAQGRGGEGGFGVSAVLYGVCTDFWDKGQDGFREAERAAFACLAAAGAGDGAGRPRQVKLE